MSSETVELKLTRVLTYSQRNNITKVYSQSPFPDKFIIGNIEKDVLDMIINMNLHVVKGLFDLTNKKYIGTKWNEDNLRTLFKKLAIMTRANEIQVVDRAVSDWFDQIIPIILQTLTESTISDTLEMYKKHGDMKRIRVMENIITTSIDKKDYNRLVNVLFDLNRVIFPNYSIGMLLCVLSELYIVFMDINSESADGLEKDDIVVHILSSYLQKLMYEDDAYIINLKNYCSENNIIVNSDANIEEVVHKRVKSRKSIIELYTSLVLNRATLDNADRFYNIWTRLPQNTRFAIYKNLGIHQEFDLLPYVLTAGSNDRLGRLRLHIRILLKAKLSLLKPELKAAVIPYYAQYDEIFNHILFPNDGVGTKNVKIEGKEATETAAAIEATDYEFNANRFDVGEFSMRSLLKSFISSGVVNKFTNSIVSAVTPP